MSRSEKIKEQIGWLKVAFAILSATLVSLVGWVVLHYEEGKIVYLAFGAVVVVTVLIILVNKQAYKKMDELEDL